MNLGTVDGLESQLPFATFSVLSLVGCVGGGSAAKITLLEVSPQITALHKGTEDNQTALAHYKKVKLHWSYMYFRLQILWDLNTIDLIYLFDHFNVWKYIRSGLI